MVATHAVVVLEMADHGLDGRSATHLASDGLGDTPDLAGDPDLEPIRVVVTAIIGVAVQRLGVQHELSAPGRGDWRGNRDLATELVGSPCLAAADALDLGRVQRIDLRAALTLLLVTNTQRQIEQRAEAVFERRVALDLAANVTDDAAEPRAQELQLPPGAFELMRMRVAANHDGGALGHAPIALAQFDAIAFGQIDQLLDGAVGEPGIGRMRDRLLLHGGVHHDPFEILGLDRPGPVGHRKAFLQQRDELLLAQPLAPAGQRRAIERQLVPEYYFAAEILEIRVLDPPVAQRLVGQIVHVLEDE